MQIARAYVVRAPMDAPWFGVGFAYFERPRLTELEPRGSDMHLSVKQAKQGPEILVYACCMN
jgi:hypothetical protein